MELQRLEISEFECSKGCLFPFGLVFGAGERSGDVHVLMCGVGARLKVGDGGDGGDGGNGSCSSGSHFDGAAFRSRDGGGRCGCSGGGCEISGGAMARASVCRRLVRFLNGSKSGLIERYQRTEILMRAATLFIVISASAMRETGAAAS